MSAFKHGRYFNPPPPPPGLKPTYAELRRRLVEAGFALGPARPTKINADAACAALGISREQFEAIPDQPKELKR